MPWPKMAAGVGKTVVPTDGRQLVRALSDRPARPSTSTIRDHTVGRPLITPPPSEQCCLRRDNNEIRNITSTQCRIRAQLTDASAAQKNKI